MSNIKYHLRTGTMPFSIGETDFKDSCGSLIDTDGCIVLLVASGYAIATVNFRRYALRKGDFILLFMTAAFHWIKYLTVFRYDTSLWLIRCWKRRYINLFQYVSGI